MSFQINELIFLNSQAMCWHICFFRIFNAFVFLLEVITWKNFTTLVQLIKDLFHSFIDSSFNILEILDILKYLERRCWLKWSELWKKVSQLGHRKHLKKVSISFVWVIWLLNLSSLTVLLNIPILLELVLLHILLLGYRNRIWKSFLAQLPRQQVILLQKLHEKC